ncbi:hypothetical protein ATCC51561_655 [Campylobacter concisus ATCC 51561]|nr:hypothetical protein ATCC51561_655 [Campylobacter concisus ATCC 51561]
MKKWDLFYHILLAFKMKKHFSIKNRTKFNGFQRELSPFD